MTGDFQTKSNEFRNLLADNFILPSSNKIAIDLGAGIDYNPIGARLQRAPILIYNNHSVATQIL
jgi:hypothetical protein